MCGRIFCNLDPGTIAMRLRHEAGLALNPLTSCDFSPSCNITPSTNVPVLRSMHDLDFVRWGYKVPESTLFVINARFEELEQKPLFRPHLNSDRCVIVCQGFYEWQDKTKVPFAYRYKDHEQIMFIAALIKQEHVILLTRDATHDVTYIHDRMPVIIEDSAKLSRWLSGDSFASVKHELNHVQDWHESLEVFALAPHVSDVHCKSESLCLLARDDYMAQQRTQGIMRYFKPKTKDEK